MAMIFMAIFTMSNSFSAKAQVKEEQIHFNSADGKIRFGGTISLIRSVIFPVFFRSV